MTNSEYERLKELIETNILKYLPNKDANNRKLIESMEYSLAAGGKRLRPILLLAAYDMFSEDESSALPFACALEYIHTYSLIHDDLPGMDNDDLRRGKPTNHKVFGEGMAIIAGDGLLNCAYEIMLNDIKSCNPTDSKLSSSKILAAAEIAASAGAKGMIAGQALDIDLELDFSKEQLNYIHEKKTGALLVSSVKAGALLGGATNEDVLKLEMFGKNLGLAFQIKDDLLDIYGDEAILGKAIGSDAKLEKKTYPFVFGEKQSIEILNNCHKQAISALESFGNRGKFLIEIVNQLEFRIK